ncbi:hypothetical protein [Jiella marina]|uniref:hypothetical protein n=1 Tax=Jiella sp. LLJ827 TaxID=2917712 RepID=UPI002101384B|nr:hypothetical protein [Jiella sp. LLJ827]MCQ0986384.1 hypothetical protein [Jiella sp. LLJ827]
MRWGPAVALLGTALVLFALAWLSRPVGAAPLPPDAPQRLSDLMACHRSGRVPAIRVDRWGRLQVTTHDRKGCVRWRVWRPMVKSR